MNLRIKKQEQKSCRITTTLRTTMPARSQAHRHTQAPWQASPMGTTVIGGPPRVRLQFRITGHLATTVQMQVLLSSVALPQGGCISRLVCPRSGQRLRGAPARQGQTVEAAKREKVAENRREPGTWVVTPDGQPQPRDTTATRQMKKVRPFLFVSKTQPASVLY